MNLLVLGDSIALGAGASDRSHGFVEIIRRRLGANLVALVRGGATSQTGADWVDYIVIEPHRPDMVIVAYGMNDQTEAGRFISKPLVPPSEYEKNIRKIVKRIRVRWPEAEILLVAPCPPNPNWLRDSGRNHEYRDVLVTIAGTEGCSLADIPAAWESAGRPREDLIQENHPTDTGHRLIADAVTRTLVTR